jgi:lantibiotic modifying enzyme
MNEAHNLIEREAFFTRLGALAATAYSLQMTDIHLDNLITTRGIPVIIDAECIFYGYSEYGQQSAEHRLISTGLVGIDASLSSICGGSTPVLEFGAEERCGELKYLRSSLGVQPNRLKDQAGKVIDPADYTRSIWDGFTRAYKTLFSFREELSAEVQTISKGMRSRFLLRLTMQYMTVIEMLRRPTTSDVTVRLGEITSVFLKAIGLSKSIFEEAKRCELLDMLDSDVPFFWIEDGDSGPALMHWSGIVHLLPEEDLLKNRIRRAIESINMDDVDALRSVFSDFFKMAIT